MLCTDDDSYRDTTVFADNQRSLQDELIHPRDPHTVTRTQLHHRRARHHDDPVHFVVGQPRMRRERQLSGENGSSESAWANNRTEQGMLRGADAETTRVDESRLGVHPIALALEGIGG
jgi:hypothetical protein